MSIKEPLLTQFFGKAKGLGTLRPGYRMASAASYVSAIPEIFDLDLNDISLLDSSFDPQVKIETQNRLAEVYGYDDIPPESLLLTPNGTRQAIQTVVNALLEPGDEVFVTIPNWPQFAGWDNDEKRYVGLPNSGVQANVKMLQLKMEDGWAYPMEELKEKISSNTKLIAVQSPGHNPTGNNYDIKAICEIAEDVGAYVLHDEIYRGLELDAPFSHPTAVNIYENAVAVNSLSKSLGLEGLRLGWIASRNKEILSKCASQMFWGTASQHFFFEVAYHACEPKKYMEILEKKRKIQEESWFIVSQWIKSHSDIFEWVPPEAAYISFVKYDLDIDSWTLCEKLLNEYKVLVIPGICYGYDDYIRIGIGKTTTDKVARGILQIEKCLETLI